MRRVVGNFLTSPGDREAVGRRMLAVRNESAGGAAGFRPELVAGGQLREVARHIDGHAGAVLAVPVAGELASAYEESVDYFQRFEFGRTAAESMAEMADDAAAREVANALISATREWQRVSGSGSSGDLDPALHLYARLSSILCVTESESE